MGGKAFSSKGEALSALYDGSEPLNMQAWDPEAAS
jgi:hypothetical protein